MMTVLSTKANEGSAYTLTIAFTDEDGSAVTPDSITWDLTDTDGNAINSRTTVSVAVPASSINITLSGDDLAIPRPEMLWRVVTIEAVYDSSYGSNLPLKDEIMFEIQPLVNIA